MTSQIEIKNHWQQFIVQQQPTALVTLTLRKWNRGVTSDEVAIKQFNQVLRLTNNSLFRKRYNKGIEFLTGFAALEHQDNGMPHVHIMITNDIEIYRLRSIIEKHIPKIVQHQRGRNLKVQAEYFTKYKSGVSLESIRDEVVNKCLSKIRLILPEGVDVRAIGQTVQDYLQLSDYLQKENPVFLLLDRNGLGLPLEAV